MLATDGADTHAVFLYQCNYDFERLFYYGDNFKALSSIRDTTSLGYRLGNKYDNFSCIGDDIARIFNCYPGGHYYSCYNYFSTRDRNRNLVLLSNLTAGCESFTVCM